jgi:hypothetical protein
MALKSVPSTGCRLARHFLVPLVVLAAAALHVMPAHAATLTRGFEDDVWFNAKWKPWIPRTAVTGARVVSLEIDWAHVEPKAPRSGAGSASAKSSQYQFGYIDQVLREFEGTKVQPFFLITDAPRWAQGKGGSAEEYADGSYEPNLAALRQFVTALARRYSGHFRDPLHRHRFLPRVGYFQAWAEANMGYKLSPQWTRVKGQLVNTCPTLYRNLLNAFYAGVKAGDPSAKVVFTGLESYGDRPGQHRTPPVSFLRSVLCLNGTLVKQPCSNPAHFDVLASDPYDVGSPTTHALNANDASAPDLGKLTRVLRAAISAGTVVPATPKPLWVTEFSYDSNPPNRSAGTPSEAEQARWLEEAFYVFAHEGVSTVIWYLLRDQTGSFATHYFSGVYFHNGKPKTSLRAYRFPFVVMPNGRQAQAWGVMPSTGTVRIQRRVKGGWQTLFSFRRGTGDTFAGNLPLAAHGTYRAVEGAFSSLLWTY